MSGGRILVADDELEVRLVLREFLSARGYVVELADRGSDALAALDEADPHVVLLDLGAADYIPKPVDLEDLDQAISIQVSAAQE